MAAPEGNLVEKAKEFARLNRKCIELSYENATPESGEQLGEHLRELLSVCAKAFELWNTIKSDLGDLTSLQVSDPESQETLKRIRDDHAFLVVRQYKSLADLLNINIEDANERLPNSIEDFFDAKWDDLFHEFHSWFDVTNYFMRKANIGCIVVGHHSYKPIDDYYGEIREAYAFGLHRAAVGLCRALIELVLHNTLKQRNLLDVEGVIDFRTGREKKFYLPDLVKIARKNGLLSQKEAETLFYVKNRAERILHKGDKGGNADESLTDKMTFDVVRDAVTVVEAVLSKPKGI